jgi:hypothetical protein
MLNELLAIAFCVFVSLITSVLVCESCWDPDDSLTDPVDERTINYLKKRNSDNAGAQAKPDAVD